MEQLSSGVHPFEHVRRFMIAGDQSIDNSNDQQNDLYIELIKEELQELWDGIERNDNIETIDAICDVTWVMVGYALSRGWDIKGAFDEVARSNMSKVDKVSGKLLKREDGKVLKPETYSPPDLTHYIT
ncbi:NTP pyrophosphohydrolase, DR2231-like [uncultured Caudovirales phage]|uniref:NTP pyrophosphohydrolase, DR2231-like n=1 Tax=uncultured Caudovirales phage TaxID=2100421 RepID=A0A6J5KYC9_9CAUD|nr:NTP pyrophosphohydrolase, DR2231-like [uncultured Caudovirales phage]